MNVHFSALRPSLPNTCAYDPVRRGERGGMYGRWRWGLQEPMVSRVRSEKLWVSAIIILFLDCRWQGGVVGV